MSTIIDIAKALNLSPSTVSRAIRNNPSISSKTKKRVLDYAKEINYFPNNIAQSLQMRQSRTIGVLVPEIQHDFFSFAIDGIEEMAHLAGPKILSIAQNRLNGYKDALKKHNLPLYDRFIVFGRLDEQSGYDGFDKLLKLGIKPDAIFAVNDPAAIGAYMLAKEKQLRIPEDIALIGFSNNPISALIDPPLTTVEQPAYEMGKSAAKLLLDQINGKENSSIIYETVLKTKLIIRKST